MSFGARLEQALRERGPLCVGVDPHAVLLRAWGLEDSPAGLRAFCETVVVALAGRVAVLKPQSAFFERFGSAGIAVLEETIAGARAAGAIVLLDVKRGDIDSTAAAYAQAYLDPASPLYADAVTVSPYLGVGALAPFFDAAAAHGGGVFVLARTSNSQGGATQLARTGDGRSVAQLVVDEVAARNQGAFPLGSYGVVVGANSAGDRGGANSAGDRGSARRSVAVAAADRLDLSRLNGPVLAPGMGAQGGTPADLGALFTGLGAVVLPSYSREILAHGPHVDGLRTAAARALADCRAALEMA